MSFCYLVKYFLREIRIVIQTQTQIYRHVYINIVCRILETYKNLHKKSLQKYIIYRSILEIPEDYGCIFVYSN